MKLGQRLAANFKYEANMPLIHKFGNYLNGHIRKYKWQKCRDTILMTVTS